MGGGGVPQLIPSPTLGCRGKVPAGGWGCSPIYPFPNVGGAGFPLPGVGGVPQFSLYSHTEGCRGKVPAGGLGCPPITPSPTLGVQGPSPCRGFGGVPQLSLPQRWR